MIFKWTAILTQNWMKKKKNDHFYFCSDNWTSLVELKTQVISNVCAKCILNVKVRTVLCTFNKMYSWINCALQYAVSQNFNSKHHRENQQMK